MNNFCRNVSKWWVDNSIAFDLPTRVTLITSCPSFFARVRFNTGPIKREFAVKSEKSRKLYINSNWNPLSLSTGCGFYQNSNWRNKKRKEKKRKESEILILKRVAVKVTRFSSIFLFLFLKINCFIYKFWFHSISCYLSKYLYIYIYIFFFFSIFI